MSVFPSYISPIFPFGNLYRYRADSHAEWMSLGTVIIRGKDIYYVCMRLWDGHIDDYLYSGWIPL